MKIKFGIDLGTTNSSIAYAVNPSKVKIMHFNAGIEAPPYSANMISSKVFIQEDRNSKINIRVGYSAQAAFRKFAFTDAKLIERLKLAIEENPDWSINIGNHQYTAANVLAEILKVLYRQAKNDAKAENLSVEGVVVGVPVDFKDSSKLIYLQALYEAGFYKTLFEAKKNTEFVSEPLAVAVHYGIDLHSDKNVLVFDFGGGTLDVTIVNLKEQVNRNDKLHPHEVKAKRRITCGGELLTKLFFIKSFCSKAKYGISEIADAFDLPKGISEEELWNQLQSTSDGQQFCTAIEDLKCKLSSVPSCMFSFMGDDGVIMDELKFSQSDFENSIADEIEKMRRLVYQCLDDAGIGKNRIDEVILAGGSSLIPCVQNLLIDIFGKQKVRLKISNNPQDEKEVLTSVVRGLAIQGAADTRLLDDIVDKDYGVFYTTQEGKESFDPIIPRNTRIADTVMNPALGKGYYSDYTLTKKFPQSLKVIVGERTSEGSVIPLRNEEFEVTPQSQNYRIFMTVNPLRGMLEVQVYDLDLHVLKKTIQTPIKK